MAAALSVTGSGAPGGSSTAVYQARPETTCPS